MDQPLLWAVLSLWFLEVKILLGVFLKDPSHLPGSVFKATLCVHHSNSTLGGYGCQPSISWSSVVEWEL